VPTYAECEAGDQAFVRNAFVALVGRRPYGQAEVELYTDLHAALLAREPDDDAGRRAARRALLDAIMDHPEFVDRWGDAVMDALRVARIEDQSMAGCYGAAEREPDDGELARAVRDNPASGDVGDRFTMRDLLWSALVADDLSPVYRAHLFALVSFPIPAANVPRVQAELARRQDFGTVFDSAYLNRDLVCLGCHNSSGAVTDADDPAVDRHWPMAGLFEQALYGDSSGIAADRAHAVFRFDGFVAGFGDPGQERPWGWDSSCGGFYPDGLEADPAEIDGRFGALAGDRLTVFDLEASLQRGFEALAADGLIVADDGTIADPDSAFAYLVSATIAESVWREVMGTPLTIANYFPRNQAARDMLHQLTEAFIASRFSLRALLAEIALSDYFNRLPPEAGCGTGPYNMPNIYDPWVIADPDEARRANGPADGVSALPARVLLRAAYAALGWATPRFTQFPEEAYFCSGATCAELDYLCTNFRECCESLEAECGDSNEPSPGEEQLFQRAIGVFHKNAERGFRGLDFQARLVWEDRFGACERIGDGPDTVDSIAALAAADATATVGDVVAAMKDRFVGDARVDEEQASAGVSERSAIEAMFGGSLDTPASEVAELAARMRAFCGVLLSSPQFLLGGFAAPDGDEIPALTPESARYPALCAALAERGLRDGTAVTCGDGDVTLTAP
jgi:hypothetical protein